MTHSILKEGSSKLERIILCIDVDHELNLQDFSKPKKIETRMELLVKGISMFISAKQLLNPGHEFAVVTLSHEAEWVIDFTSNLETIREALLSLKPQGSFKEFNMSSVFQVLNDNIDENLESNDSTFVYRAIIFYARSNVGPTLKANDQLYQKLIHAKYFYLDVLYMFSSKSTKEAQQVYDEFMSYESEKYMLLLNNATPDKRDIFINMAKLLSNPLQRTGNDIKLYPIGKK